MDRKNRRFPIVMVVLMLLLLTCNMPLGKNGTESEPTEETPMEIVDQAVYTTDAATHAAGFFTHPETAELLAWVQSEGYTRIVESGDFVYSNGRKMYAVSLSDGETLVILLQMEIDTGTRDAFIVEVIDEHTVLYRDKSGSIEIVTDEDGEVHYEVRDAAGKPISITPSIASQFKLASIEPKVVNACSTGMGIEFYECMTKNIDWQVGSECLAGIVSLVSACMVPPFAACIIANAVYFGYCWSDYPKCSDEALVDNPPTFDYSGEQFVEPYAYCQENSLFRDDLFQAQVECNDDRQPKPANFTLILTSGEAKEFTCTDCSGQTSGGTIPPPGEVTSMVCEYGCLAVGEGKDRCLNEGETPELPVQTEATNIPVGTYVGFTTIQDLFTHEYVLGTSTENSIVINIAEDGTVTGEYRWVNVGNKYTYENGMCLAFNQMNYRGVISGMLTDFQGVITIESNGIITHTATGGEGCQTYPIETNDTLVASISINGDVLYGEIEDAFTFTASK